MTADDIIRHANGDILRNADGTPAETVDVVNETVAPQPTEKKFSLAATTDKMGITTAGQLSRAFFWGLFVGAGVVMGIGLWKDKISISYTK
jgi:hypothetical protein